jgi:hypothetical protein
MKKALIISLLAISFFLIPGSLKSRQFITKNDPVNKILVFGNSKLVLTLDYDRKCRISCMEVNGEKVTDGTEGICNRVRAGGKTWSTLATDGQPVVKIRGNAIMVKGIVYGDPVSRIREDWHFTITETEIIFTIERTLPASLAADEVSFPSFSFNSINTWEGAFLESGGLAWFYLFTGKQFTYGVHSGYSAFWNSKTGNGLSIGISSPGNQVAGRYTRSADDRLIYEVTVSGSEVIPRYDAGTNRRRFIRGNSDVWSGFEIPAGTVSQSIILTPFDYRKKYNRGKFAGIDGDRVTSVLNTIARIGVIDDKHFGGNSWHTPYGPLCLHEQYIAQFGIGINDDRYLKGYMKTLDFYRDHAIRPDGRVLARWAYDNSDAMAGTVAPMGFYEAQWGYLMDSNPDYVINVSELYDQCGDLAWVAGHQAACERALEFMLRRDSNGNHLVEMMTDNHTDKKGSDWIDIIWASFENAFVNAEVYRALVLWSDIERQLGNQAKASYYSGYAEKLKDGFNRSILQGGFWDEGKQCYIHWRDKDGSLHGNNMVTPVNFMAIAYGICDDKIRSRAILDQIEDQMQKEKLFFWPICLHSYQPGDGNDWQFPFPNYENGDLFLSWGSVAVQAYASYDPELAVRYIRNVLDRHRVDGLAFQRYGRTHQDGLGDDILSGNSLAVVGLYQSIYGINPRYNRMYLDPHMTAELSGTELIYHYRGNGLVIGLDTNRYSVSNGQFSIQAATDFGFHTKENVLEYFNRNENISSLSATVKNGQELSIRVDNWTDSGYSWIQTTGQGKSGIEYRIGNLQPGRRYVISINGKTSEPVPCGSAGILQFRVSAGKGPVSISVRGL